MFSHSRTISRLLLSLFIFVSAGTALPVLSPAQASEGKYTNTPIDPTHLKGIDTAIVQLSSGPVPALLREMGVKSALPEDTVLQSVKSLFHDQSWVSVQSAYQYSQNDAGKTHVLGIFFTLSARHDIVDGKQVTVAALSVNLRYNLPEGGAANIYTRNNDTFPFVLNDDQNALRAKLSEGIRFLIGSLPSYMYCVNKAPNESLCIQNAETLESPGARAQRAPNVY